MATTAFSPRSTQRYTALGAVIVILLWGKTFYRHIFLDANNYHFLNQYGVLEGFNGFLARTYDGSHIMLLFLTLHHLRLFLGFSFVSEDDSFVKAVRTVANNDEKLIREKRILENFLRFGLLALLVVMQTTVDYQVTWWCWLVLAAQASLMALYHLFFHKELYHSSVNPDCQLNRFIAIGDGVFGLCVLYGFLVQICHASGCGGFQPLGFGHAARDSADVMLVFLGAYVAVLIGEYFTSYRAPLKETWGNLKADMTHTRVVLWKYLKKLLGRS